MFASPENSCSHLHTKEVFAVSVFFTKCVRENEKADKLFIASQTMPDFQKSSQVNKTPGLIVQKDQHETNTFNSRDTESSNNHSSLR